jgi:hypothetical protein
MYTTTIFLSAGVGKSSESGQYSYIYVSEAVVTGLFFRFRGDQPLHNIQYPVFRILAEGLNFCFTIPSMRAFLKILLVVLSLPRGNYSFKSQSLIPLLPSWHVHFLLLNVSPLGASLTTLSLCGPWRPSPLYNERIGDGLFECGRQPASSRTHHCPGFTYLTVSSTLWLDASSHNAPYPHPLLLGLPDALLQTSFLDRPPSLLSQLWSLFTRLSFQPAVVPNSLFHHLFHFCNVAM